MDNKKTKSNEFFLRAHHGMCLQFFVGEGYSGDFTTNMASVKKYLEDNNPLVTIIADSDHVCEKCPNLHENGCLSSIKVSKYDEDVLNACSIESGNRMKYEDFIGTVKSQILEKGLRRQICGDCMWSDLCG